jgi:adenosylmethionine-8-amino-7-oxononanoate aminotransferase
MNLEQLLALDRAHLIHPVSNYRAHEQRGATVLVSGHGPYVRDAAGNELLDAFSGLWCVNVGFGQDSIVQAAADQLRRMPYVTAYFDFISEPAAQLAGELVALAPTSLRRVYFTQGGSDAIDAAIRFITHYYQALGQSERQHFIALERGYHGSSALGSGLTALPAFHRNFQVPQANQHHIPCPYPYRHPEGNDAAALIAASVASLHAKVRQLGAHTVAAFCCEPIMGSGGVIVPPPGWLKAMRQACTELGILMLVDEVITGFGRTGPMFACQSEGVAPDLMTLAKGLTSGYAPMGALLMSEKIYATMADATPPAAVIGHGQTYSAHPVSAAIALEVLRLYQQGGLVANAQARAPEFAAGLQALRSHPLVGDARQRGLLGALELVADKHSKRAFTPKLGLSDRLSKTAYRHGLIFRAFADGILGFAPAFCYSSADFDCLFTRLRQTLDAVLSDPDVRAELA